MDTELPKLKKLTDFLSHRCQALEAISSKSNNTSIGSVSQKGTMRHPSKTTSHVATSDSSCIVCKDNHHVFHCNKFRNYPVTKRYKVISSARLCKNCLRTTEHATKNCTGGSCRTCQGKHHTLLYFEK